MQNVKAWAAILAALFMGAVAATLLTGCQPAKPKISSSGPTSATTSASPDVSDSKGEIKDEKPAEEKPAEEKKDEKAADEAPVVPKGETPTDANPAGVKPEDVKPDEVKPERAKPEEKSAA